eukprot:GAHX01001511.1.p1 GENE.GAHX01001511.1~~GAHX01001511.1.p1  ORF type:complete len:175 (+),score=4.64 GAHX01001511.1:130-654(+)
MINILCFLLFNKSLQSSISLKDYLVANKATTINNKSSIKLQNLTPTFTHPQNTWLIFKIYTNENNELLYVCFNFDHLQNLKFKNSFDIGFSPPTLQTNLYSPLITKEDIQAPLSNNPLPLSAPDYNQLPTNHILFLDCVYMHPENFDVAQFIWFFNRRNLLVIYLFFGLVVPGH